MGNIRNISRRSFVKVVGLASGGLVLACNTDIFSDKNKKPENLTNFNPNLFVQLNSDGSLILVASRSEMGNGVRTSLPSVIADEMEADWTRVSVKQAVGDNIAVVFVRDGQTQKATATLQARPISARPHFGTVHDIRKEALGSKNLATKAITIKFY